MMLKKKRFALAMAALALLAQPAAAPAQAKRETIRLADGKPMPYMSLVRFWDASDAQTMGDTPNEKAPGFILPKPGVYVHGNVPKGEAAIIERKLKVALDALLAQTPLKDIHGSSLMTAINISRGTGGQVQGSLTLLAYPITLTNPQTIQKNGRYHTPGEGAALHVYYNAPLEKPQSVKIVGEYDGIKLASLRGTYAGLVTKSDRPLTLADGINQKWNPGFFDTKRPASDLQLLWFFPPSYGDRDDLPTGRSGRLAAAAFMVDWNDIVRRMGQVR